MGRVERAAMILHADSGSPYWHHVSIYAAIQLMDVTAECIFSLTVSLVLIQLYAIYMWSLNSLVSERLLMLLVLSLITVHIIPSCPSHGCLYGAPGPLMAGLFQVSCF